MSCRHHRWEIVDSGNETHELPMNDISQKMKVKLSPRKFVTIKSRKISRGNEMEHQRTFCIHPKSKFALTNLFLKMHAFSALITFFEQNS